MLVPGVQRIAVLRANGIGDFVFALPALAALRAAYPGAEITLLGLPWHRDFLEGRPGPDDRVVAVPRVRGVGAAEDGDPAERAAWFGAERARGYDLALQLHGGGAHSNPFLLQLGAKLTAGLRAPTAPPLDRTVPYVYWQNEYLRCLEVAQAVGARPAELEPRLAVLPADLEEARRVVRPGLSHALLHIGAGDARRRWPPASFVVAGRWLAGRGHQVLVSGGPAETAMALEIAGAIGPRARCVAGELSLRGLLGVIASCALVVGNDSGPLHLAVACGVPAVGIFWAGNLVNASPPFRAAFRPVLSWRVECPVCGARTDGPACPHDAPMVDLAPVAEVLAAAEELVAQA